MEGSDGGNVVVLVRLSELVFAFDGGCEGEEGRAITAAKLVLTWRDEVVVVVVGAGGDGGGEVVVEHESGVGEGFSGELATFEE